MKVCVFSGSVYIKGPMECPSTWRNVSTGFDKMRDVERVPYGVLPVLEADRTGIARATARYERRGDTAVEVLEDVVTVEEAQAEAVAAESERIDALVARYGGAVAALRARLVQCGYDLPASREAIVGGLMAKSAAGLLTTEQTTALLLAGILIGQLEQVSDADINAVWERMHQ